MNTSINQDLYELLDKYMKVKPDTLSVQELNELNSLFEYCREGMESDSQKFVAALLIQR